MNFRWPEDRKQKHIFKQVNKQKYSNNEIIGAVGVPNSSSSTSTLKFALRCSWPAAGWDFLFAVFVMTEQMVRLPVWAPLWVSDAFQSSWPAPGSCSSLEALRCSVSTPQVSPCLQRWRSEQISQARGVFSTDRSLCRFKGWLFLF